MTPPDAIPALAAVLGAAALTLYLLVPPILSSVLANRKARP